ncbi:MAG: hypothetical protein WC919_06220 [Candidatus Paceibacterota bacterium]|jgi:hypothetical protein
MRLLLSESVDWKLDVIDSYEEISPNDFYLNREVGARKGDKLQYITYLAFLESINETGLKFGITVRVELIVNDRSGIAWIDWIGKGPHRHNNTDKAPSYANLRHLLSQIAKNHPHIKFFAGNRESGMREKFGKPEFKLRASKL